MGFVGSAVSDILGQPSQRIAEGSGAVSGYRASTPPINMQNITQQIENAQDQKNFVDYTQANQTAQQQQALAQMLLAQAQGQGPSPADIALQQATNRNIQQNSGMIASQKGINPALAARLASQNAASAGQQAVGQGALMRAQEQLAARQQLGGVLGEQRGQDIAQATQNRALQNQYIGTLEQAQAAQNQAINQAYLGASGLNQQTAAQNAGAYGRVFGGITNSIGGFLGLNGGGGAGKGGGGGAGTAMAGEPDSGGVMFGSKGGKVPGVAKLDGDHEANDTVPAMLSPGEIVIPRSHAKDADKAKAFIDHLKGSKSDDGPKGYAKVLDANRKLKEKIAALEKQLGSRK